MIDCWRTDSHGLRDCSIVFNQLFMRSEQFVLQRAVHNIALKIPHSIAVQDVLSDYDGDVGYDNNSE